LGLAATAAVGFNLACSGQSVSADPITAEGDVSSAAGELVTLARELVAPSEPAAPSGVIYVTLRRDLRRCAAPLCGGFFVQRVNRRTTLCADGARSAECYVAELAFDALGLSEEQASLVRNSAEDAVLRGSMGSFSSPFGELGRLDVTEAWLGHSGVEPRGAFVRVRDTGLRCITTPCLSFSASLLEFRLPALPAAEIALEGIADDTSDASAQLGEPDGLLVAGRPSLVSGPAGTALGIEASEYYIPLSAEPLAQSCGSRGLPECPEGTFCSFPPGADCGRADAPGTCAPRPEACIQLFDPVCGCDGQTHGNACSANSAGVSVDFDGPCEEQPSP
jgi:hypothetical protein